MKKTFADGCTEMVSSITGRNWVVEEYDEGFYIGELLSIQEGCIGGTIFACESDAKFISESRYMVLELARRLNKACKSLRSGCAWYCSDDAYKCSLCKAADELEAPLGEQS